ncbi:MAG TPA: hypothetical protein VI757_04545 [Bacteroidia bacterium]|nr:hypothetical protein [Bacteroidia bacterium]
MKRIFLISLSMMLVLIGTMAAPTSFGFAVTFFTLATGYFVYALLQKRVS